MNKKINVLHLLKKLLRILYCIVSLILLYTGIRFTVIYHNQGYGIRSMEMQWAVLMVITGISGLLLKQIND